MRVVVASKNPAKMAAAEAAFRAMFPDDAVHLEGVAVESGVSDQPMTGDETLLGADNRATNARSSHPQADYWVGIEGGLEHRDGRLEAFGWMVVLSKDGKKGMSQTATFLLPEKVQQLIQQGMELGEADDIVFNRSNSKQANGAVGLLTDDRVTRSTYYEQALMLALIPHKNPDLYP